MTDDELLGLPLDRALEKLKQEGLEVRVVESVAPRTACKDGTKRVVRVRPGEITVCTFQDGVPQ